MALLHNPYISNNSTILLLLADDIILGFLALACLIPTIILPCVKICKLAINTNISASSPQRTNREDSLLSTDDIICDATTNTNKINQNQDPTQDEAPTYGELYASYTNP